MQKKWLADITIKTAKASKFPRFRHGAVIAKGGRVISAGVNTVKPRTPDGSFSTHAEIIPLKRLLTMLARTKRNEQFEIYVARVTPADTTANSRPCPKCLKALKESGVIATIHFTTDNGNWNTLDI